MVEPQRIIILVIAIFCFIFLAASTGGNSWVEDQFSYFGLWKVCSKQNDKCMSIPDEDFDDRIVVTRVFMIFAVLWSVFGIILIGISFVSDKIHSWAIGLVLILTSICSVIACSVFIYYEWEINKTRFDDLSFAWAYYFGWIGAFFAFMVAAVGLAYKIIQAINKASNLVGSENNVHA